MRVTSLKIVVAMAIAMGMSFQAQALTISPTTVVCGTPECLLEPPSGVDSNNENEINQYIIDTYDVDRLYKADTGGAEDGIAETWYSTTFAPPGDYSSATITWDGGSSIVSDPIYLVVKDGNQTPSYYVFDISNWDGEETVYLTGFWESTNGAISNVAIYGNQTSVPDGGSTMMLLGSVLLGMGTMRRRFKKN